MHTRSPSNETISREHLSVAEAALASRVIAKLADDDALASDVICEAKRLGHARRPRCATSQCCEFSWLATPRNAVALHDPRRAPRSSPPMPDQVALSYSKFDHIVDLSLIHI